MLLDLYQRGVGVFARRQEVAYALEELRKAGFPEEKVSVVARDSVQQDERKRVERGNDTASDVADGAATGALAGGLAGGLLGLLESLGVLLIPGIGPILAGGVAATAIATTLAGSAIGAAAGSLIGVFVGLGIPEDRAIVYNERVLRGDYLVMVEGTEEEVGIAEAILTRAGIQDWSVYNIPAPDDVNVAPQPSPVIGKKRAVGVFSTRQETEAALEALQDSGFPMETVSVIARDGNAKGDIAGVNVSRDAGNKADIGAAKGALAGGTLGGLTGLLVGVGALAIPGLGPIVLAGATATALATTLTGTAIGAVAGGLVGALIGLGIPEERARAYSDRVSRGGYLVIVDGTENDIRRAEAVLSDRGIQDWGIYDPPVATPNSADYAATGSRLI